MSTSSTEENGQETGQGATENGQEQQTGQEGQEQENGAQNGSEDGDTFPRSYVEKLRKESQGYRDRAKKGETAISRLTEATMRSATNGILVDSSDLTYDADTMSDEDGFPDPQKIKEAAQALVEKKPHLAPRRPRGDIGQGTKSQDDDFSLAGLLRNGAG